MTSIWEPEGDSDGYLSEEWLAVLKPAPDNSLGMSAPEAARFLVETFPRAVACVACARIEVKDGETKVGARPCKLIEFSTGGWSGAEELIGLMLEHFWIGHFHTRWERGGHYWFEVPVSQLGAAA